MRHHDRPGQPDPVPPYAVAREGAADGTAADDRPGSDAGRHTPPSGRTVPARTGGRHRKAGGLRRRARRRPGFRTAVTVAGTAAAVLTVAAGMYVATLGADRTTGTRTAAASAVPSRSAVADVTRAEPEGGREDGREAAASGEPGRGRTAAAGEPEHARTAEPGRVRRPAPATPSAPPAAATPPPLAERAAAPDGSAPETPPTAEAEQGLAPRGGRLPERPGPGLPGRPQPAPQGAAPVAAVPAVTADRFVKDVVALANAERKKAGCGPLRSERHLRTAAQRHADDMSARGYYEHDDPEGRDAGDRMTGAGYAWTTWGENIHRGPKTPGRAMADWMGSPGHRANILNCAFEDIGVGVTLTANGPWWVQNFGVRR
ncbi:CAP domain-containing protein [Streptomyces sp. NPDC057695]|uniref:CAP domain-containing protein n=1 Tax=unclassified Streptomyces TaxID=2593676 RepID=UPI003639F225